MDEIFDALKGTLVALLRSRKIMLLFWGVVQTVVAHYFNVPAEIWAAIDALILAVIGAIAVEDAAQKRAGGGG